MQCRVVTALEILVQPSILNKTGIYESDVPIVYAATKQFEELKCIAFSRVEINKKENAHGNSAGISLRAVSSRTP